MSRTRYAVGALSAVLLAALTACVAVEPPPSPSPTPRDDAYTQFLVDVSWTDQTEDDKWAMCDSIAQLGTDWAADTLKELSRGYGTKGQNVDWDYAALLLAEKCVREGYS